MLQRMGSRRGFLAAVVSAALAASVRVDVAPGAIDSTLEGQVAWLNTEGGFEDSIDVSQVAEAAEGLNHAKVMDILDQLEDRGDNIRDPTRWIVSSFGRAKAVAEGLDKLFKRQLRNKIRWLNTKGGFENKIIYSSVAAAAVGLDPAKVMEVLGDLEGRSEELKDPTALVFSQLRRAAKGRGPRRRRGAGDARGDGDGDGGGGEDDQHGGEDQTTGGSGHKGDSDLREELVKLRQGSGRRLDRVREIKRRIYALNTAGSLQRGLYYDRIAEAAEGVPLRMVMGLLRRLEEDADRIEYPTRWVCSALRKMRTQFEREDPDFDRKLRGCIAWLNTQGGFENRLFYSSIAESAFGVDSRQVLRTLRNLEAKGPEAIDVPTSWVCAGLLKMRRGGGGGGEGGGAEEEELED